MPRKTRSERGYDSEWYRYRERFLRENPLCVMCDKVGRVTPATVVDHIKPHKGDRELFVDKKNHQGLCDHCHSRHKQILEKSGRVVGCDASGLPLDAGHPWNK